MSSREIAELLGSRHDDVKRSIERLAAKDVFTLPPLAETSFKDAIGKTQRTRVYLLDKRSSLIVVAQLSPEFTARVVDRWQELEAKVAAPKPALPDFTNPVIAARAWADEYEGRVIAEAKVAELLGSRHDNVKRTIESLVMRAVFARPQSEDVQETGGNSRAYTTRVYLLDKRSSLIVVAQLSPEFTARVVDRWQELEAKVAAIRPALPDFTNPVIAARAWADGPVHRKPCDAGCFRPTTVCG